MLRRKVNAVKMRWALLLLSMGTLVLVARWPNAGPPALSLASNWTASLIDLSSVDGSWRLRDQAVAVGPGLLCYRHTNDREREMYGKAEGFYACHAQRLCVELRDGAVKRYVVPVRGWRVPESVEMNTLFGRLTIDFERASDGTRDGIDKEDKDKVDKEDKDKDKVDKVDKVDRGQYAEVGGEMAVLQWRFRPHNAYHELYDVFSNVFETAYAVLGRRFYDPVAGVSRSAVRLIEMGRLESEARPFDGLYAAMTGHGWRGVETLGRSFCVANAWLNAPSVVREDGRTERQRPARDAPARIARMLAARETVRYLMLGGEMGGDVSREIALADAVFLTQNPMPECAVAAAFDACDLAGLRLALQRLAAVERQVHWPRTRWPNGTVVLYIPRTNTRRITNEAALVARLRATLSARGYPLIVQEMSELPASQQVLVASRATVVVGPHGAGLAHALWMQAGGALVELRARWNSRQWFPMLTTDHRLFHLLHQSEHGNGDGNGNGNGSDSGGDGSGNGDSSGDSHSATSKHSPNTSPTSPNPDNPENADYAVDVDGVVAMVLFAVHRSDRVFGPPPTATHPVTPDEALDAVTHFQ